MNASKVVLVRGVHRARRRSRSSRSRSQSALAAFSAVLLVLGLTVALPTASAAAATCTGNAIVCENQLQGTDPSIWDIQGAGDDSIQGFATQISVNRGDTVQFKIKTNASAYTIQIFRLGYYQGKGARKIDDVTPSAPLPQIQPACATDSATEIYDCGTWGVSASWAIPSTAVSGVYIALLERSDTNDSSQIPFIIRDDASHSEVVYQTSDTTWQAYNTYGGSDYYVGLDNGRAYKVSYNRPFATRSWEGGRDYLFSNEYPMIRFLESNGYDISYISGLDTDIRGNLLTNHKAFLSVGHDEYWSAQQRSNVEAARDAGVNLAFFSGNEVYWKTRWEPSEDGTNTANRTLVCYKDTWANAPIDPVDHTATWRDPRFGDNGHGPENALTGTIYMSNFTDLPLTVSADEGALRLWRNTGLDHPASGTSTQLAPHTVGYESDEDLDNGFRPAGLIRLSTTTGPSPQYLTDFGNTVVAGTTTHHVTMYKAASGALVFGAGTVQWSWALDTYHDGTVSPVDTRMQQATVNVLADMGAAATSLTTPGVVAATKSTDTVAPTAVITSPAAGANLTQGSTITVTGTATDAGGGVVAGVEVSLDSGSTWHPATGRGSFSYTGVLTGTGSSVVRARAVDDSGNIQGSPATVNSTVDCPCSIFGSTVPKSVDANDASPVTLGVRFTSAADGFITGLRFYKSTGNTGTHTGALYKSDGTVLSTVTFTNESASGWQTATFQAAVPITAGSTYTASYVAPNGHYSADSQYFAYRGTTSGPLTALGSYANPNGVYTTGSGAPTSSYQQTNYYVDAIYSAVDTTPLTVVSTTPIDGSSSVPTGSTIGAVFSRDPIQNTISLTVTDPNNQSVQGTTSYDQATRAVTFTPSAPFATGTTYSVSLTASAPNVGAMASPASWSFKTALPDHVSGVCPCGLFNDSDTPGVSTANDPNSVELGIAFSADMNGLISGVRFYKGASNSGSHTVSLWSAAGNLLASAQVTQESAAGWQEAAFSAPVSVTAGTSYIVSYRAPNGRYAYTADGLAAPIVKAPLSTPANAGRYTYGTSAPLSTSSANYYVDPVFTVDASVLPAVSSATPPDRATSVPTSASVLVTFNTAVQPGSTSISLTDASGQPVPGTVSNQNFGSTAGFTPNDPLTAGTTYTITVSGAKNLGGAAMGAPWTATFTTSGAGSCPCSVLPSYASPTVSDSGDGGAVSLGLQFKSDMNGFITGLRYYRDAANTGAHSGTLYAADGTVLGTLTFQDGPAGWQTASFAHAVPVTAGTTYVAGTFMPNGHYSYTSHFFDSPFVNSPLTGLMGTYAYGNAFPTSSYNNGNYYVDVSFSTTDPATAPAAPSNVAATAGNQSATVTWTAPADGGSTITSYNVTPYQGSTALASTVVSGSPAATSAAVGGLTNGTAYTFQVTATNAVGTGPASAPSAEVTPFAPAFVQQQNARATSATSVTATPAANVTAGNRLVVMVGVKGTATSTAQSVTDSAGNTYVKITQFRAADSTEMSLWTAPITAGGGTKPVVTAASSESATLAISVLEYAGLSAAADLGAVDKSQTATGTTTAAGTVQSGATGPTSSAGELAVGFYLDGGVNQSIAAGSGYTERVNGSPNESMQYLVEDQVTGAAGASADAGFQAGASTTWLAATVVFVRGA